MRITALLSLSEVARMSDPHAEMSTAGVIIADRTEIASGKFVMLLQTPRRLQIALEDSCRET